jgi:hypothetical protein
VVLLGDSTGSLHLCSLVSEKLIATKQVASSRITAIVSCDTNAGLSACLQDSSSSSEGSNTAGAAAAAAGTKACRGTESTAGSSSGAGRSSGGGSYGSKGGSCVQFAVMSEDTVGLWQLRQGFSHGIVPGGHRQGVITLQLCCSSRPQVGVEAAATDSSSSTCYQAGVGRRWLACSAPITYCLHAAKHPPSS